MVKPVLEVLGNRVPERIPVWLMRQAGRYLPEYRALREKAGSFLDLCLNPAWAAEITLQPIRRFDFDAAILFADILLVPYALGQKLEFREGEGPVLGNLEIENLIYDRKKVEPVFETVQRVKAGLSKQTTLIGFCGAPWTVACYMIDGNSKNGFSNTKQWLKDRPQELEKLISILIEASLDYLSAQIQAGAEVIQIFDSWAGLLDGEDFNRFIIQPTAKLVQHLEEKHPSIPIIGFPREAGRNYRDYILQAGVDGLSIDQHVNIQNAKKKLQTIKPLQGNLSPELLVQGGEAMKAAVETILLTLGPKHIFNLGHGVVPQTPPEHVADLVRHVRNWKI